MLLCCLNAYVLHLQEFVRQQKSKFLTVACNVPLLEPIVMELQTVTLCGVAVTHRSAAILALVCGFIVCKGAERYIARALRLLNGTASAL